MRKITHVVMHTAAAERNGRAVDQSAATIRAFHVRAVKDGGRGWSDIGYHWVVRMNGTVEAGRAERQTGAGVEGFNATTVHVCCSGHGDLVRWWPAQWAAAVTLVCDIVDRYDLVDEVLANPMRVLGHSEVDELPAGLYRGPRPIRKTCPGEKIDMSEFRRAVVAELRRREG